jgi:hypothetical protein
MTAMLEHAPTGDRVRANTWHEVNERIDRRTRLQLRRAGGTASSAELATSIERLDREWSFDRLVEAEAALTGLIGLALGARLERRWLVLPGVVSSMLLLHAIHGWYPLLPIFRRLGVRTQNEMDKERYALKALRGDFHELPPWGSAAAERAAAAWQAVCS